MKVTKSMKKSGLQVRFDYLFFAVALAKIASDVKAADIKLLFVKPLVYWTKFFLITTAFSRPQIDTIRTRINDLAEKQYGKFATGDAKANSWTLLDFGRFSFSYLIKPTACGISFS
ncbi:hypothetical protein L1987_48125 [Smallanthus sonchifolius]|uniref:Uncharacterized protein n=1 Tax=Smallanthus sonchifolius TaxID=185202 RepID=A0ACB9FR49_9ASTR|nr:hypothetical protein L1987_48125 [Smallanthus sonchifolius]